MPRLSGKCPTKLNIVLDMFVLGFRYESLI